MKKITLALLLFVTILSCKKSEENETVTIGNFTFSSNEIIQNEPFTITYNGEEDISESFFYKMNQTKTYPEDISFKNNMATIVIPDSINAVAFNFKLGENFDDNNKQGYLFKVKNKNKNTISGAEASLEMYKMFYGEQYGLKTDEKFFLKTLNEVIQKNPELSHDWSEFHMYLAKQVDSKQAKEIGENYLSTYLPKSDKIVEDYVAIFIIYDVIGNKAKSDSISKIIIEKYPKSGFANQNKINKFFEAKGLDEKEAAFNENKDVILKSRNADYVVSTLARSYWNKDNKEKFDYYFNLISKSTEKASLLNEIAWAYAEKGKNLDKSLEMSKKSLDLIGEEQIKLEEKPDYFSHNQYKNSLVSSYNLYADTYALLAFKKGDTKEAIKYQEIAVSKNANPEMKERYIQYLMVDEQYEKVKEKASDYIEKGSSTNNIKEYFIEAYEKTDDIENPEVLLAELEKKAKSKELEAIRKTLIDEEAIDFTMKDLDGKEISLSSLKGKTVVLDFWATWCGPCIASFPGMQKVVTKYKDDENVVFFFVDTFESGENRLQEVTDFIKKNNYDFHVLIDPKVQDSNAYEVAKKYGISGIPTKVIIGPNGRIKFKSVGYSGSAEKIVSEIDTMVEILRSNP